MHGIGNDYVTVNGFDEKLSDPAAVARVVRIGTFGLAEMAHCH